MIQRRLLLALISLIAFLGPFSRPDFSNLLLVGVMVLLGLSVTGVTEWVREAVRKPYVIYGYMYSNGIRVQDVSAISQTGVLPAAKWATVTDPGGGQELRAGAEMFRIECRSCHTLDGYNAVRPLVKGWREEFIDYQLQRLNELKGFMPPFVGRPAERRALARWLAEVGGSGPLPPSASKPRVSGESAGAEEVAR